MNSHRVTSQKREFPEETFDEIDWTQYTEFPIIDEETEREKFIHNYINELNRLLEPEREEL